MLPELSPSGETLTELQAGLVSLTVSLCPAATPGPDLGPFHQVSNITPVNVKMLAALRILAFGSAVYEMVKGKTAR